MIILVILVTLVTLKGGTAAACGGCRRSGVLQLRASLVDGGRN